MDWLVAGFVYVPAYIVGKTLVDWYGFDPFMVGWIVSGLAIALRYEGPQCIRSDKFKTARGA